MLTLGVESLLLVLMKDKAIKIRKQDLYEYIIGEAGYHPIEAALDENYLLNERYEIFDAFIYDCALKKKIVQDVDYINFVKEVDKLRQIILGGKQISKREIVSLCIELHEIAPKTVLVDDSLVLDLPDLPTPNAQKIKEVFGLDGDTPKFADFKKSEEDHALEEYEKQKKELFEGLEENE